MAPRCVGSVSPPEALQARLQGAGRVNFRRRRKSGERKAGGGRLLPPLCFEKNSDLYLKIFKNVFIFGCLFLCDMLYCNKQTIGYPKTFRPRAKGGHMKEKQCYTAPKIHIIYLSATDILSRSGNEGEWDIHGA